MDIPEEKDWGNWKDDLDVRYAHGNFAGKSISEAIELFVEHSLHYQEDLQWMPIIPFQFYIHAYMEYIISERSKEDSDGASCYLRLIKLKLENEPEQVLNIFELLLPSLRAVADRQNFYDANIEIYGDFKEIFSSICRLYNKLSSKNVYRDRE